MSQIARIPPETSRVMMVVGCEAERMELATSDLDSGILAINLSGRMDINGTQQIDLKFTSFASTRKAQILVDLSNVTFISSIGIRTLVNSAKAQKLRGGSMVLYKPIDQVEEVLKATGIDAIIPITHNIDSARAALGVA
jgi:anti-sigma B factor antagonist